LQGRLANTGPVLTSLLAASLSLVQVPDVSRPAFRKGRGVLASGAAGLGLVIGWAGGFSGSRPAALAFRLAAGAAALLAMSVSFPGAMAITAGGLALAALGHEAFAAGIRRRRSR
jgi:hypothetical protein